MREIAKKKDPTTNGIQLIHIHCAVCDQPDNGGQQQKCPYLFFSVKKKHQQLLLAAHNSLFILDVCIHFNPEILDFLFSFSSLSPPCTWKM